MRWLWQLRILIGAISVIVGIGGRGKSTLTVRLIADLTRGALPGEYLGTPVPVIVASAEDPEAEVLVPRLRVAGADLDLVYTVRLAGDEGTEMFVTLPDDLDEIERVVKETGAKVLLFDPTRAHLTDGTDTNNEHSVRRVLAQLQAFAERNDIAVVLVDHPNKRDAIDIATRVSGAGVYNAVRSVLVFGLDPITPDDPERRCLAQAKNNFATPADALRVILESTTTSIEGHDVDIGVIKWDSTLPDPNGTVYQEILDLEDSKNRGAGKLTKTKQTEILITAYLTDRGPQPAARIRRLAKTKLGVSDATIDRASQALTDSRQIRKLETAPGSWAWELVTPLGVESSSLLPLT